ncbi:MAG: DUF2281 domain-containing protein [Chthoniobacterales bacterium]|nr:DUF2281 domain-containing protein [Chthoniobacterales bacterium]
MSTLAEIEAAVETLPTGQKEALFQFLAAQLRPAAGPSATGAAPRIAGLHEGAAEVAPDFDEPLPDEFWLGQDA